ncbi:MAG TPA: hypothetical protein VGB38_04740 [bacterium]
MKKSVVQIIVAALGIALVFQTRKAIGQYGVQIGLPTFTQRNMAGPRLGFTFVPGNGELASKLKSKKMGPVLSQFGWHFEYQVVPETAGPSFVVELVPLVAGVEYGTPIPSASLAMGIRFPGGFEFGLGPNVLIGGDEGVYTALIASVGRSFNYSGVSIPLNLVCATSPKGNRYSIIFGYAITKSVRRSSRSID